MTITIFNSKDKEQKKIIDVTSTAVLDSVKGKDGWWAKVECENGDYDVFHYFNGGWSN